MPSNKNQHFLPQHYLRLFSVDNGRGIAVTRLDPFKFVIGPIKGQCQKDWFYRSNGQLDDWLRETESAYGGMLPNLIRGRKLDDESLVACRFLAALFNIRTEKAADTHGLLSRRIFFDVVNDGIQQGRVPPPPPDWSMQTVAAEGVSGFLVKHTLLQAFFEMATLQCKLLEPSGSARFITSDHPVACMNQLFELEAAATNRSYSGFSRSGFQLFFPLHPTLCLFFYDPKVYKVGHKRDNLVSLPEKDVELVNSLQVQTANQCLYSSGKDPGSAQQMQLLVSRYSALRQAPTDLLNVNQLSEELCTYHWKLQNIRLVEEWSFCRLQRKPRVPESRRRDQAWTDIVNAFLKQSGGLGSPSILTDFARFVESYCGH